MPQFEAVFNDGMVATFEADSMKVEAGLVVLERDDAGASTTVVAIGANQLLFIRDTDVEVEMIEGDVDDWDDDEDWDADDDDDDEDEDAPGLRRIPGPNS
jgi:hypothetical protein